MAKVGYIRVSTVDQNLDRQEKSLKEIGVTKLFSEKISGKDTNRPQLQAMLGYIREGDTVYIHDFSRLARSTKDLLELVETFKEMNVTLVSLKESLDTSTANGKLMLTMLAAINEFERENLLERQREGIAIAKEKGKYKGRKKIERPPGFEELYGKYTRRELTATAMMKELGLKRNTFYKLVDEYKEELEELSNEC